MRLRSPVPASRVRPATRSSPERTSCCPAATRAPRDGPTGRRHGDGEVLMGTPDPRPLHDDHGDSEVVTEDGRIVRNLSAEEYAATYADGEPHAIPADVLAELEAEA